MAIATRAPSLLLHGEKIRQFLPFDYPFEEDADVDIVLDGKSYEIDSPYDRDSKLKKVTKETAKKKSTKRKRR